MQIVSSFVIFSTLPGTASSALAIASCLCIALHHFKQTALQHSLPPAAETSSRHLHLSICRPLSCVYPQPKTLRQSVNRSLARPLRQHLFDSVFFKQAAYGCCSS
ncbi:hypothetical protein ACQKWADRAFT_18151 [Trichoderma austrokoningii]